MVCEHACVCIHMTIFIHCLCFGKRGKGPSVKTTCRFLPPLSLSLLAIPSHVSEPVGSGRLCSLGVGVCVEQKTARLGVLQACENTTGLSEHSALFLLFAFFPPQLDRRHLSQPNRQSTNVDCIATVWYYPACIL